MATLSERTVPNKGLVSTELAAIIVDHVREMLAHDYQFNNPTLLYRKAAFTVTVVVHAIDPSNPVPRAAAQTHNRVSDVLAGEVPLEGAGEDAVFAGLERRVDIENPNLHRVHHDLPIKIQQRGQPKPGDPFGSVENIELRYDKTDFEPLPPVETVDVTEREAAKAGVKLPPVEKSVPAKGKKPRPQYNVRSQEDLDAISSEEPE